MKDAQYINVFNMLSEYSKYVTQHPEVLKAMIAKILFISLVVTLLHVLNGVLAKAFDTTKLTLQLIEIVALFIIAAAYGYTVSNNVLKLFQQFINWFFYLH
ncbi:hypothetical protein ACMWD3_07065 [Gardnerella swidsinskii]|uniref:Uncharacterized protein n=1 Tax=Gardnerella swidsinskii TaxID=2792979 RepID=A0ABM6GHL2_9BIFI|nr:hypothetical protein BVL65_00375 [Gardnerella vaginalis]